MLKIEENVSSSRYKKRRRTGKRLERIKKEINHCFYYCMKSIDKSRKYGKNNTVTTVFIRSDIADDVIELLKEKLEYLDYNAVITPNNYILLGRAREYTITLLW